VRGVFGKGFVSAEMTMENGKPKYNSLTVTHAKTFERLLLEGVAQPAFRVRHHSACTSRPVIHVFFILLK
jgi:hypothetical protein